VKAILRAGAGDPLSARGQRFESHKENVKFSRAVGVQNVVV